MNTHCCEYFPGHRRRRSMGRRVGNVIMGHLFSFNPKCPSTTFSRITDVTELRPGVIWSRSITTSASSSAINHNTTEAESPPPHTELLTDELERTIRLWWLFCWPVMCESKRIHSLNEMLMLRTNAKFVRTLRPIELVKLLPNCHVCLARDYPHHLIVEVNCKFCDARCQGKPSSWRRTMAGERFLEQNQRRMQN